MYMKEETENASIVNKIKEKLIIIKYSVKNNNIYL